MDKNIRILIIEDSEDDALLEIRELKRGGFNPVTKRIDTPEAMKTALKKEQWDVIISDHSLPRFNSLAALNILKQSNLDIPFIIISGVIGENTAVEAMKSGAHDYIMKNNMKRLVPAVEREIEEAEIRKKHAENEQLLTIFSQGIKYSNDSIIITSINGDVIYSNEATVKIYGFDEGELVNKSIQDLCPNKKSCFSEKIIPCVKKQGEWTGEIQQMKKDGSIFTASLSSSLIKYDNGKIVGILNIIRDITERKKTEDILLQSLSLQNATLESTADGILVVDTNGKVTSYNQKFLEMWHIPYEVAETRNDEKLLDYVFNQLKNPEEFLNKVRYLYTNPNKSSSDTIYFKDGRIFERFSQPQKIKDKILGRVWSFRDITERKNAEESLQKWANIFKSVEWGVSVSVDGKTIDMYNPAFARMHYYNDDELIGKPFSDIYAPDVRSELTEHSRLITEKGHHIFESKHIRKDGTVFPVLMDITLIKDKDGNTLYRVANCQDITEQKKSEENLRKSEERFMQVADSAEEWIWEVDKKGLYTYSSPVVEKILGYKPEEVVGKKYFYDFFSPKLRDILRNNAFEYFAKKQSFKNFFNTNIDKNGNEVILETSGTPILNNKGELTGYRGIDTDITDRKKSEEMLQQQLDRITILRNIDIAITSSMDLRVILNVLVDQIITQLHVDATDVLMLNPTSLYLEYASGIGFQNKKMEQTRLRLGEGIAGRIALNRQSLYIPDFKHTKETIPDSIKKMGYVAYLGIPLLAKGQVKGVIEIFNTKPFNFELELIHFVELLAGQTAIAIDNSELLNNLQHSNIELTMAYETTIEGWSRALDYRDKETEGHSQRVAELSMQISRFIGVVEEEIVHIRRGALLHDIGKVGVPDAILLKPSKLTEEEFESMKQHPVIAYKILSPIDFLRKALDIPYCHHEKWDGTGYPRQLKAEEIPLSARIFAVVDVWDALLSTRPYRPPWTKQDALNYIKSNTGKHFDPKIVEVFLKLKI